jgi:phosphate transport system substrate-binding protein
MSGATLQNRAGKWVTCSEQTIAAAAATKPAVSAKDFSIVDAPGANSFPISGYSWVVVYKKPADSARAKMLYDVLAWLVGPQGQSYARSVDYVPLPVNVQNAASATLRQMQR